MKRLQRALRIAVCLAGLACGPVQAHDFWIEPATFRPAPGGTVALSLRVGQQFHGNAVPFVPKFFQRFVFIDPQGVERAVDGQMGDDPAGSMPVARAGTYLVGYRSNRDAVSLKPDKFESYLVDEGLEAIIAERARLGESAVDSREEYSRCAKALLRAGDGHGGGHDRILGFTLELVPERDPYAMAPGANFPVRLLYLGKPLAGALVVAFRRDKPEEKLSARTDSDGRAVLALASPGIWLVKAVHMIRVSGNPEIDWESFWASLTFELPG